MSSYKVRKIGPEDAALQLRALEQRERSLAKKLRKAERRDRPFEIAVLKDRLDGLRQFKASTG